MPTYIRDMQIVHGDRQQIRRSVIEAFLQEEPGNGTGELTSRYQYNVEQYDKYAIYLKRPTQLNKGFDFTVNISGLAFKKERRYSKPSHDDVMNALICCRDKDAGEYEKVAVAINQIFRCEYADLSKMNAGFYDYKQQSHPIQIILLAIRWLFIEQDCAYWNYSGRQMLYNALMSKGLI